MKRKDMLPIVGLLGNTRVMLMRKGTQDIKSMDFIKRKQLLHQYFKQLKAGMIVMEDVPEEYRILLMKYYSF